MSNKTNQMKCLNNAGMLSLPDRKSSLPTPPLTPHPSCHRQPFQTSPLCGPKASSTLQSWVGTALALLVPVPTIFFFLTLRRNQRKLEAQGSAEATQGQEVQSTPHFLRGGGFVTATCWGAWATHTNYPVR